MTFRFDCRHYEIGLGDGVGIASIRLHDISPEKVLSQISNEDICAYLKSQNINCTEGLANTELRYKDDRRMTG